MGSMSRLVPVTTNSFGPCGGRQLPEADTCAPTKTPVRLLRSRAWSQPACSSASHVQVSSIRSCGSMTLASRADTPNRWQSNR